MVIKYATKQLDAFNIYTLINTRPLKIDSLLLCGFVVF